MELTSSTERKYQITLRLDSRELLELRNSIYEACSIIGNWRSDPTILRMLQEEAAALICEIPEGA